MKLTSFKVSTVLAVAVACSLALVACSSADDGSSPSPSSTSSSASSSAAQPIAATITFTSPGNIEKTLSKALTATSTSDAPISFASQTLDVCSIPMGSTQVVALTEGTCTITASQSATDRFLATTSQVTLTVLPLVSTTYKVTYSVKSEKGRAGPSQGQPFKSWLPANPHSQSLLCQIDAVQAYGRNTIVKPLYLLTPCVRKQPSLGTYG
ncbi:unannotated protein [freshwater metagenome]|uniref:Unannotated protein n=1 Tax=freshwater metagenome TaxID=449393 RepID=A0A6J7GBQ5_9ZZZZ